jgi:hypothetical protein
MKKNNKSQESLKSRMLDDRETPSDVHERFTAEDPMEAAERKLAERMK